MQKRTIGKLIFIMDNQFVKVRLEPGTHYVCACGRTGNKPLCDGSHAKTNIQPLVLELEKPKEIEVSDLPGSS